MVTYLMDDGTILKTENAVKSWKDRLIPSSSGREVSVQTGTSSRQTLHMSRKHRFWIETFYCIGYLKDEPPSADAKWISNKEAVHWLLRNGDEIPEVLDKIAKSLEE